MSGPKRYSRGFVTLIALAMLGLVAATTAILLAHMRFSVLRSSVMFEDAQLRQLLAAGAQDVADRSREWESQPPQSSWSIDLPSDLANQQASLKLSPKRAESDAATVQIEAHLGSHNAFQVLSLRHVNGQWRIIGTSLDVPPSDHR